MRNKINPLPIGTDRRIGTSRTIRYRKQEMVPWLPPHEQTEPTHTARFVRSLDAGRGAGRTDRGKLNRKQDRRSRDVKLIDRVPCRKDRSTEINRTGSVVLNPLAEVGIRVLVPIGISRSQFVVHVLRDRKGCNGEQQQD